jgi:hypothetical protein
LADPLLAQAARRQAALGKKVRLVGEATYQAASRECERRVVD